MIKPGYFGQIVPADNRRMAFDYWNEQLLLLKKHADVLFMGDSILELWDIPAYIGNELCIVNRAISGDNSTYLLRRFDADCVQLAPKRCILMIGTNDISEADYDFLTRLPGQPADEVFERYKSNISGIIRKCDETGIELSICSVIPSDIEPPYDKELRFSMTNRMNMFLIDETSRHKLSYIDFFPALCLPDNRTMKPEFTDDGIHPNAECYKIMAGILMRHLHE